MISENNLQFAAVCLHETEQIILKKKTQKIFSCKQTVDNNNYLLSNFDEKSWIKKYTSKLLMSKF